jgi:hypothetical protein
MTSRRGTVVAALVLCAVSMWGFAAAGASAESLTAVTCKETAGTGTYNNPHCETPKVLLGNFDTAALPLNTTTEVEGTSTELTPTVRATIAGVNITIVCETGHVIGGSVKNEEPRGKMVSNGTATRETYTGCHAVLKANEARFCAVEEVTGPNPGTIGMISTTPLKGAPTGVGHQVKIEPQVETLLSKFNILKKGSVPGTEKECFYNVTVPAQANGSVEGEVSTSKHSHLTFTEANNGENFTINGAKAKYLDTVGFNMSGTETTVGAETF